MKSPKIIFEDRNIAVLEKPQGMPSQKDNSNNLDLLSWASENLDKGNKNLKILNRLDQPVGGLLIVGKTDEAVKKLSRDIQNRNIKKDYIAVVFGKPENDIEIYKDNIIKISGSNFSEIIEPDDKLFNKSKKAELSLKVLDSNEKFSLVNIRLKTGRHHQIRVQTSYHGIPIYGDTKYANEENTPELKNNENWLDIALWAYKLIFVHPISRKQMTFYSLPDNTYPWSEFYDSVSVLDA